MVTLDSVASLPMTNSPPPSSGNGSEPLMLRLAVIVELEMFSTVSIIVIPVAPLNEKMLSETSTSSVC